MQKMRIAVQQLFLTLTASSLLALPVSAADIDPEIDELLTAIGTSGCTFIRNGSSHPAAEAEQHLRMKYGKAQRYISGATDFINRIASKSSWSGKAYMIQCPDQDLEPSADWLDRELQQQRQIDVG